MYPLKLFAVMALAPTAALAQGAGAPEARYEQAPWWMAQPIIASSGYVQTEYLSNRASFAAGYKVVDRSAQDAETRAADKVRTLVKSISALGAEKVRVATSVNVSPIYEQYRDKDGRLITNQRSDKIESYEATANVQVEVRDMALLERAYTLALAAGPTSTGTVRFSLEPTNQAKTQLFQDAVRDAARRARLAAEATGAKLGAIKLIDPTGRACETDVLVAGAGRGGGPDYAQVEARPPSDIAPPPPLALPAVERPIESARVEAMQLVLQPPLEKLQAQACVVFALAG